MHALDALFYISKKFKQKASKLRNKSKKMEKCCPELSLVLDGQSYAYDLASDYITTQIAVVEDQFSVTHYKLCANDTPAESTQVIHISSRK